MNAQELYDKGKYSEVIKRLKKDQPSELLAYAYQKNKQWEEAMNIWNALIISNPKEASYYNDRGVCKFNLRFKHAIQDFDKAISLAPDNAYYYSCRAYIKDKTGDTEGSIQDYEAALKLDPEDAITLNNLGLAEQKLGYTAKARERFKYSDDLLGVKTIDSRESHEYKKLNPSPPEKTTLWKEFKKMFSISGFRAFLDDLKG